LGILPSEAANTKEHSSPIPLPRQTPRQPLAIQFNPIVCRPVRHVKHMYRPSPLFRRMPQPDFRHHHLTPIRPPKPDRHARVQPTAKRRNYLYSLVQKKFIIHIKNPQNYGLRNDLNCFARF
jgi:hypothetical protein